MTSRIAHIALAAGRRAVARAARAASPGSRASAGRGRAEPSPRTRAASPPTSSTGVLLGDVALQRGETSLAARAYLEAARERTRRRARATRDRGRVDDARMRGLAQEAAKLWATLDPAAERPKQILAALAAGDGRRMQRRSGIDSELQDPAREGCSPTRRSPSAASARSSCSSIGCSRDAIGQGGRSSELIARAREAVSDERRSALRRRARRATTAAAPRRGDRDRVDGSGRSRARAQARLGARGAAEGGDPRAQEAATRRSSALR